MKQKTKFLILAMMALFGTGILSNHALASTYGGASVWWVAPTKEEDNTTNLTDLAGYRVFYGTAAINCTNWDNGDQTYRSANPLSAAHVDVLEANTMKDSSDSTKRGYTFRNGFLLTAGQTYNFAVVAYDTSNNYSKCATGAGAVTTVSKAVSYAADIYTGDSLHAVNYLDYGVFHSSYGNTTCGNAADITGPDSTGACTVDLYDYNILHYDYGKSF